MYFHCTYFTKNVLSYFNEMHFIPCPQIFPTSIQYFKQDDCSDVHVSLHVSGFNIPGLLLFNDVDKKLYFQYLKKTFDIRNVTNQSSYRVCLCDVPGAESILDASSTVHHAAPSKSNISSSSHHHWNLSLSILSSVGQLLTDFFLGEFSEANFANLSQAFQIIIFLPLLQRDPKPF